MTPPLPVGEDRPSASAEGSVDEGLPTSPSGGGPGSEPLFTPSEVASLFRVRLGTVGQWARTGKLRAIRTPGGPRRFPASDVYRLLEERKA